jgi:hypothetical protein
MTDEFHLFPGNDQELHVFQEATDCLCGVHIFQVNQFNGEHVFATLYVHSSFEQARKMELKRLA